MRQRWIDPRGPIFHAVTALWRNYASAMRCAECGHPLSGIDSGAPCTECGMVTPDDQREPGPLPSRWVLLARFGWPTITGTILLLVALASIRRDPGGPGPEFMLVLANLCWLLLFPACAGWQAVVLMRRMPRRQRNATLFGLLPRSWAAFLVAAVSAAGIAVIAEVGIAWVTMRFS
jgi:hypothetical protein